MSQMPDFCLSNSIPPIFYGNNHFDIYDKMIAQNCSKFSLNQYFGNFKLPLWIIFKELKFLFLVNLHQFVETIKPEKMKSLS